MRGKEYDVYTELQKVPDQSTPEGFIWVEQTVYVPSAGTKLGAFKGQWGTCQLCGYVAPLSELNELDGRLYCSKYNCYQSKIYEANRETI